MVNTRSSRRMTLGPIPTNSNNRRVTMADPLDNANFDSLKPKSKRSSKQRMSMIPRMSGTGSTTTTTSNSTSNNTSSSTITPGKSNTVKGRTNRGRKSMGGANMKMITPNSPYDQQHQHHNHRRQSNIPPPTIMRTDTRPISDKTYFNKCIKNLHAYLEKNQYEHPIKLKDLTRPSGKDFHNIMLFLLSKIDTSFYNIHYNSRSGGGSSSSSSSSSGGLASNNNSSSHEKNGPKRKFEDDVAMMFKTLGYPFNISKTALVAAGSPHTWPSLLLAITWLIELLNTMSDEYLYEDDIEYANQLEDNYMLHQHHQQQNVENNIFHAIEESGTKPLNNNSTIMEDILDFEKRYTVAIQIFIERSYDSFLTGDDAMYEQIENQVLEYVDKDLILIEQAWERIEEENGGVVARIRGIEQEFESLPTNENRLEDLAKDLETFHDLVNQLNTHKNSLADKVQERKAELEIKKGELDKMEQRIQDLLEMIATQEYSIEDVYQLERERAKLEESLTQMLRKREEHEKLMLEKEQDLKRELERLDRFVIPYNECLENLAFVVDDDDDDDDDNLEKFITIDKNMTHEKNQEKLLGNVDLKNKIVPLLQKMEQRYTALTTKLRSQMYELKEDQTRTEEEMIDQKEKVEEITSSVKRAEDIFQQEKEENEVALAIRQKEVENLEEKVEALRDPSAVETVMSKYHSQINDLNSLCKKHQEGNLSRKQAVLSEFNNALRVCHEYKMYTEKELSLLQKYLKSRQQFDVVLSVDEQKLLSD